MTADMSLVVDRSGWEVIPQSGTDRKPRMEKVPMKKAGFSSDGTALKEFGLKAHIRNFLDCMISRQLPNADISVGAKVAKLCQFINISHRVSQPVHWDEANKRFAEPEANRLIKPEYSAPWKFPRY